MKTRRVELFASNELDVLEEQMNAWFSENLNAHVIDVRFSGTGTSDFVQGEPVMEIIYTAIVFYEVVKE